MSFEPIVTEYTILTEEEHVQTGLYVYRNRLLRTKLFSLLGLGLFIAGFAIPNQIVLFTGLVLVFIWPMDYLYIKEHIQRYLKNPANEIVHSPTRAIIADDKIEFESQSGVSSVVPWSSIHKVEKLGENYLLYLTQNSPIVMVPRAQSSESWIKFGQLIESKFGKV